MRIQWENLRLAAALIGAAMLATACGGAGDPVQPQSQPEMADDNSQSETGKDALQVGEVFDKPPRCNELSGSRKELDDGKLKSVVLYGCEHATVDELSEAFRTALEGDGFKLQDVGVINGEDNFVAIKPGVIKITFRLTLAKRQTPAELTHARAQWFTAGK